MILRRLPGPFLGWLGTLMFLFLMQFLMKYLPDIVGKGLPLKVILELIAYNLAYMVVLAVPMSALLSALMTFGQLADSNSYLVIKSAGISLVELIWPVALAGSLLAGGMMYFNNIVLPEANFRAKNLWHDIRSKKPGFELQPGIFYDGLGQYSILVKERPPGTNRLRDITIYDYTEGSRRQAVIKAKRGRIEPQPNSTAIDLLLQDGEMHRILPSSLQEGRQERYERLIFDRYRMRLDLSDFAFERSSPRESYRSDRTTPTVDMIRLVDSLDARLAAQQQRIHQLIPSANDADTAMGLERSVLPSPPAPTPEDTARTSSSSRIMLTSLSQDQQREVYTTALRRARNTRSRINDLGRTVSWETQRADRYRVEIHKKISIALACLIFMIVGAPLGLSIRRGGLGTIGALAMGIFLFYWITLVQGEKLADRELLTPWVGMWAANLVLSLVGVWLFLYVWLDLRATPPLRRRLWHWMKSQACPGLRSGITNLKSKMRS